MVSETDLEIGGTNGENLDTDVAIDMANDVLIDAETGVLYHRITGEEVDPPSDPSSVSSDASLSSQPTYGNSLSSGSLASCASSASK